MGHQEQHPELFSLHIFVVYVFVKGWFLMCYSKQQCSNVLTVEHIHWRKAYDILTFTIVLFFWEEQVWRRCFYTVYLSEHCNQDVSQSQLLVVSDFSHYISSAISLTFRSNVVLDRFDSLWFVPSSIQFVLFSLIFILFSSHHLFMLSKSFCIFSSIDSSDLDDPWIVV